MGGTEHGWGQSFLREAGTEKFQLRSWKYKFGVRYKFSELHSAKGQLLSFENFFDPCASSHVFG